MKYVKSYVTSSDLVKDKSNLSNLWIAEASENIYYPNKFYGIAVSGSPELPTNDTSITVTTNTASISYIPVLSSTKYSIGRILVENTWYELVCTSVMSDTTISGAVSDLGITGTGLLSKGKTFTISNPNAAIISAIELYEKTKFLDGITKYSGIVVSCTPDLPATGNSGTVPTLTTSLIDVNNIVKGYIIGRLYANSEWHDLYLTSNNGNSTITAVTESIDGTIVTISGLRDNGNSIEITMNTANTLMIDAVEIYDTCLYHETIEAYAGIATTSTPTIPYTLAPTSSAGTVTITTSAATINDMAVGMSIGKVHANGNWVNIILTSVGSTVSAKATLSDTMYLTFSGLNSSGSKMIMNITSPSTSDTIEVKGVNLYDTAVAV